MGAGLGKMKAEEGNRLRSFCILIVLGALGAVVSVPLGYAGSFLFAFGVFPLAVPQLMSGVHVFWLVLASLLVPKTGSAAFTGGLKGLVEAAFFSHLGVFAIAISLLEGVVVDLVLRMSKRESRAAIYLSGGFSAASNLLILQLFFLSSAPIGVVAVAYVAAFFSGLLFGSYMATRISGALPLSFRENGSAPK